MSKSTTFLVSIAVLFLLQTSILLYLTRNYQPLDGDAPNYHTLAVNLIQHGTFSLSETAPFEPSIYRTPGYPIFLALVYEAGGFSFIFLRVVQFGLLALTGFILYRIATRFVDERAAIVAGCLCIFYLPLVLMAIGHGTEVLSTFLTVLLIFLLIRFNESGSVWFAVAIGLVAGYSALTRPSFSLFIIFLLGSVMILSRDLSARSKIKLVAVSLSIYVICLIPWTLRNEFLFGQLNPFGIGRGWSLAVSAQQYEGSLGAFLTSEDWEVFLADNIQRLNVAEERLRNKNVSDPTLLEIPMSQAAEIERDRIALSEAKVKFSQIPISSYLVHLPLRMVALWAVTHTVPDEDLLKYRRIVMLECGIIFILFVVGIIVSWRRLRDHWLLWVPAFYLIIIHSIFHVEPRYSLPAHPFLLVYAGVGAARIFEKLKGRISQLHPTLMPTEP